MKGFSILMLTLFLGLTAGIAHAQFAGDQPAEPALQFGRNNTHLKNILTLQNQMQLLQRLIDHEKAVNQMIEAAVSVGISNPAIPTPDRALCSEVPANIPCAQAYESLYDHYSVVKEKPVIVAPPVIVADTAPKKKIKEKIKLEPVIEVSSVYWTNITCLNGNCSAVISADPKDPKASYRISAGEKLPDGSIIHMISAAGVTIMRNNKMVQVEPAPKA